MGFRKSAEFFGASGHFFKGPLLVRVQETADDACTGPFNRFRQLQRL